MKEGFYMYHGDMERVFKLYINKESKIKVEDDVEFELINLDEIQKILKKENNQIPLTFDIKYKLTIHGRDYFGKTIYNSNEDLNHEFDPLSPIVVKVTDCHLEEENPNLEITINK